MTSRAISTPLLTLAALALCGSISLAQQTPAPPAPDSNTAPTAPAAPIERHPPSDRGMRPGMSHRADMTRGRSDMMREGGGGFRGGHGGGMDSGFHIAPPGMWWKNPRVVERLTLTPEQTKKMDDIFQQSRLELIDLRANVEKQEVMLEPMLSANPLNTAKAMAQIDKVAQTRADLEKANAKMLLGIRAVLTPDQWTKLSTHQFGGPGAQGGPGANPGAGGPGGRGARGGGPGGNSDNMVEPIDQP